MFVKPGPNTHEPETLGALRKVRFPRTHALLPEEGTEVPEDQFWLRRLRDGDVVRAEAPKVAPAAGEAAEKAGDLIADGHEHTATLGAAGTQAAAPEAAH
jgi:aminoglycoside phosphotransferase (APT) family kinase protein